VQHWTTITQSQEVLIAFICGIDGLSIMQQVMDLISSTSIIGTLIGGVLKCMNIF